MSDSCRCVVSEQPSPAASATVAVVHDRSRPVAGRRRISADRRGYGTLTSVDRIRITELTPQEVPLLRSMLEQLDAVHHLRDSAFASQTWLAEHGAVDALRLIAVREGRLEGFLAGQPEVGHIALVGVLAPRNGVGSALVAEFVARARTAGACRVTLVIDSEPWSRWDRRRFFERHGFAADSGSSVHFQQRL